jgi:hypothetical protein
MKKVPPEQLALEIEDIIRTMPGQHDFQVNPDKCVQWLGRAGAAMSAWDFVKAGVSFEPLVSALSLNKGIDIATTTRRVLVLLHQAKNDLRLICTKVG